MHVLKLSEQVRFRSCEHMHIMFFNWLSSDLIKYITFMNMQDYRGCFFINFHKTSNNNNTIVANHGRKSLGGTGGTPIFIVPLTFSYWNCLKYTTTSFLIRSFRLFVLLAFHRSRQEVHNFLKEKDRNPRLETMLFQRVWNWLE